MMQTTRSLFFIEEGGRLMDHGPDGRSFSQPAGESRRIWHVLALRDDEARDKLAAAVRRAAKSRMKSVLVFGSDHDRKMITVRPAREEGLAVVTCTDLVAAVAQLDQGALADLFSLSPAEAEIAVMLAQGSSLAEVAGHRSVQPETVRGQVKTLLRKIGVANQKQLASILAQVGAAMMDTRLPWGPRV
ncbi:MAG: transcriptional regulator,LuxR family [Caulobacteraceae bacterium]|nr:transcriptional regulator,LuxR family [Caulobacteraceae bacterium]